MKVLTGWKKIQLADEFVEIAGQTKCRFRQGLPERYFISVFICTCHVAKIRIINTKNVGYSLVIC
jgi:hypothetical protein